ncbi:MAG: marine proteobacterial sortase target protein [Acidobacteriota bacterium]|nr:marine proteobacterial sortase target protein [Acidobacteriota bacterium]
MIRKLAVLIILLIPIAASAQVTLDEVKSGALLLKTNQPGVYVAAPTVETDVELRVRGLILRGEVTQRFLNPGSSCVEAIYAFPLPEDSAVDTLRMRIGNRVIEGEIKEKEDAKKTYEKAKREGKKASLLTQERPNLFTVAIANIGPGENVTIAIAYQQNVDYKDGAFRLRFPMTVGPRYMPRNTPMMSAAVPTDTAGTVSGSQKSDIHLTVDLDSGFSLRQVLSTYHKIDTTVVSGSRYKITLLGDVAADHDFELVWQPDLGGQPRSALFTENDYALLMIVPPAVRRGARLPKETILIIDTSGSMGGPSIDEAKSALLLAIDRLDLTDTFNIIEFNSDTHVLWTDARPATAGNVVDAKRWVDALHADGGTEMLPALEAALRDPSPNENVVRQVIFMTDGQVGNESQLFSFIRSHLGRSRLFTVGIGAAPNSHFMRDAARFGRGTFTYIGSPNEMQEKMTALFEKLESPVLTTVELRFDDPAVEMWPQRIPDLYAGEPVVVAVKFSKPAGRVIASAKRGSEEWNDVHNLEVTSEESGIGRLWARRKIEALTDGEGDARQQVVELALAHHLVSQYTSLVAVDHTPSGVPLQNCETRAVPVNLPQGWGGVDGSLPGTATPAPLYILTGAILLGCAAIVALRN